ALAQQPPGELLGEDHAGVAAGLARLARLVAGAVRHREHEGAGTTVPLSLAVPQLGLEAGLARDDQYQSSAVVLVGLRVVGDELAEAPRGRQRGNQIEVLAVQPDPYERFERPRPK